MTTEREILAQLLRNQEAIMEVLKHTVVLQNRRAPEIVLDLLNRRRSETAALIDPPSP